MKRHSLLWHIDNAIAEWAVELGEHLLAKKQEQEKKKGSGSWVTTLLSL